MVQVVFVYRLIASFPDVPPGAAAFRWRNGITGRDIGGGDIGDSGDIGGIEGGGGDIGNGGEEGTSI